ncbi:putative glutamate carboxypeptidase protein [Kockovaella imperatae]|uniref:Putative glutamate carboxypeptidase protein n=1 Tax=Kockovaella imperatae TaxID=4999 RepID=A0A1Y1UGP9_9TREE|nr:putative glutamate carboxypeptidase protein [Kockovaella imperatae]ORX36686.1 putative glutamate carboxypeptidase protein [Kockovaella imperatae]
MFTLGRLIRSTSTSNIIAKRPLRLQRVSFVRPFTHIPYSSMATSKINKWVDENQSHLIDRLAKAVGIPSVSGNIAYIKDVERMAEFLIEQLTELGVKAETRPVGKHQLDGKEVDLPPVVIGHIGNDPNKKTLLIYGHYDVQPALKEDGWKFDPFTLTVDPEGSGKLYGRGSTDDKGPVLGWLNALEAHKETGTELPVNLKMIFEGMEENGSDGLDKFIESEKDKFFAGVDCMCISDNYWLDTKTPCLTYGLRGINYYEIRISGPDRDLHSGAFGGAIHEPMTDLISLMSKLVSPQGEILIPGVKDLIAPVTKDEQEKFEAIHFEMKDIHDAIGGDVTLTNDTVKTLMGRMRNPSLSLHGIEGAFSAVGSKTVIPCSVKGKFSIRLVPNLGIKNTTDLVIKYVNDEFMKLGSKNKCQVVLTHGGEPWITDPNHYSFRAAHKATETVWGQAPDYTREGGSIPITLEFANILGVNICLLPVGRGDDGAHSTNEKLDTSNYIQGTKLFAEYMHNLAAEQA